MTPRQEGKKKTARSSDCDNEEGIDPKHQYTTSTRTSTSSTTSVSVKKEKEVEAGGGNPFVPDSVASAAVLRNATTVIVTATATATTNNNDVDNNELPTPVELSKKLCRIVDPDQYSRVESCRALYKLYQWADTEDAKFMEYFYMYGGILIVIDFLKGTLNDLSCVGTIRMESIEKAGRVIGQVSYPGEGNRNIEIITKIIASAIDCNCIYTLLSAHDEYSGGDDVPQLKALDGVWIALRNIIYIKDIVISRDQAIILFQAGFDIISQLKSYNGTIASRILDNVFNTLAYVVGENYMNKKHFQNKHIFSKCLDVFRKDGIWGDRSEEITDAAIYFLSCCRCRNLLEDSDDYEMILPFLAVGLKKFGSNPDSNEILMHAITLIHGACDSMNEKKIIEQSGVMEPLVVLLASNDINEDQKQKVREVIGKITAP